MMRTANPALNAKTFSKLDCSADINEVMTLQGTVNKTGLLLILALMTASWVWNMFFESGLVGIGFSLFVVVVAALNLVLDFDFIENGAEMGAPKYMEWYAAFGLMVTLVWLYIEILRLLSKLRSRD